MIVRTHLLAIVLFFTMVSCQQSTPNNTETNNLVPESQEVTETSTTTPEEQKTLSKLDNIDLENNKLVAEAGEDITKAVIKKEAIILYADMMKVHRIFGYEAPDVNSKRLLVISVFTNDVEDNPFNCALGAYYDTDEIDLTYIETASGFVKANATASGQTKIVYIESKWVVAE